MSQRIRTCTNSTNFDTINCDAYLNRLGTRDKPLLGQIQRCKRDRAAANVKTTSAAIMIPPPGVKSRTAKQQNVEVTVRTHTGRQARVNGNCRQSWSQLLKSSKSIESTSTFDTCDPLRTIHFLSKELDSKLRAIIPSDPHIFEMISSMQQALTRVPPDILSASSLPMKSVNGVCEIDYHAERPEKLIVEKNVLKIDQSCQTHPTLLACTDSVIFQKQLEASTAKLETSCKQMERLCTQLKEEKEHAEDLLQLECEKVSSLKKQLEILRDENNICYQSASEQLARERKEMEMKLKQLKSQFNGTMIQELQASIQELESQKNALDEENIAYRHKLATADMEKEKYMTLLSLRDRQISEIVNEMNSLQSIISEQLVELQKTPILSAPSSQSTMLDSCWSQLQANTKMKERILSTLYTNKERDLSTSSLTQSINSKNEHEDLIYSPSKKTIPKLNSHFVQKIKESGSKDIQNMFNELTQQALFINTEPPALSSTSKHLFDDNVQCGSVILI